MNVRYLIADDEPHARRRLHRLVHAHPWLDLVGTAATGRETVAQVHRHRPELVFLDVQMPGLSGLQAMRAFQHRPLVVFTTAYSEYAPTAFDLEALDYLLKPVESGRLAESLRRVRDALGIAETGAGHASAPASPSGRGKERIFVRVHGHLVPVACREILRLEADGDYVAVHTAGARHFVSATLSGLHGQLDQERFVRVHRGHIVNLDHVRAFRPNGGGRMRAELRDGTAVPVSRRRSAELRSRGL